MNPQSLWLFWGVCDSIRDIPCGLRLWDPVWENDSVLCRGKHLQLLDKQVILGNLMAHYTGDQTNQQRRAGHLLCFVNLGFGKIWKDSPWTHVYFFFGVLTYMEWCEQCVFTDGQGRHDSAHSAHDKFTKYWGQRRQCAAVERAVFASVLQHHLNYEL